MRQKTRLTAHISLWVGVTLSVTNTAGAASSCKDGYRVKREYRDATLGNSWLMMENCDRPQTPWIAVIAGSGNTPQTAHLLSGPVIHAGSRVFVYKTEADVHIHLSGTVLEGGVPGATVHVRVLPQGAVLTGVVQGADSIELTRPPMVLVSEGTR